MFECNEGCFDIESTTKYDDIDEDDDDDVNGDDDGDDNIMISTNFCRSQQFVTISTGPMII